MPYFYMGFEMVSAVVERPAQLPPPTDNKNDLPVPVPAVLTMSSFQPERQVAFSNPLSLPLKAMIYKLGAVVLYSGGVVRHRSVRKRPLSNPPFRRKRE